METHQVSAQVLRYLFSRWTSVIDKVKLSINPYQAAVRLSKDKAYIWNGQTGLIQYLPFTISQDCYFLPFTLKHLMEGLDDQVDTISLQFDFTKLVLKAINSKKSSVKIQMFPPPENWAGKDIPEEFSLKGVYPGIFARARKASEFVHSDASLPLLTGVKFGHTEDGQGFLVATDQRSIFIEDTEYKNLDFVFPSHLLDGFLKIATEPLEIGFDGTTTIFIFYSDCILYGLRVEDDSKYPSGKAYANKALLELQPNSGVFSFDSAELIRQVKSAMAISEGDGIKFEVSGGQIRISNLIERATDEEWLGEVTVISPTDIPPIAVSGTLLIKAAGVSSTIQVKADGTRLLASDENRCFGFSRRVLA